MITFGTNARCTKKKEKKKNMQFLEEYQRLFEDYLQDQLLDRAPETLYEPVNYIMQLGGKRIRPVLTLLGYRIFRPEAREALPLAYAVELFHNFSLVHDDIMDEAPLRRGKPSVHTKWDVNTGILSGDAMLILTYDYFLQFAGKPAFADLLRVFNRTCLEVCEGQQMDMDFERRMDVRLEEYLKMIELKTAALIGAALELGAIAAGATAEDVRRLATFGREIGIAFQLQDDILDTYGDPAKFGKKVGGDIAQNKKTYLAIKALERADDAQRARLTRLMTTPTENETEKIQQVMDIFEALDIKSLAITAKDAYQERALAQLRAVKGEEAIKAKLQGLAEALLVRDF